VATLIGLVLNQERLPRPQHDEMRPRPLVRNVLINLAGQAAPVLAAAVSMPLLARGLGLERLGLLTLAWVVLGSFGLLDLGLGRALTQVVASKLAIGDTTGLPGLLIAGSGMLFGVGMLAACAIGLSATALVSHTIKISPVLEPDALNALYLVALGVPFMMASSATRGFLEAHQRFGLVNAVRAPVGVVTYAGPVFILPVSQSVTGAVAVISAARIVACVAYAVLSWSLLTTSRTLSVPGRYDARELISTGLWMTFANVVASLIAYADRFVVGGAASAAALAYYATPQEIISRLTILPTTIAAVMFPAFTAASAQQSNAITRLFEKNSIYSHLALFPITFLGAAWAPLWLSFWMGADFASRSTALTQWFCMGIFANGLAVTPLGFLQAVGRADLTAKFQICELPIYLVGLFFATSRFGITGAAIVWTARTSVDALLMYLASARLLPHASQIMRQQGQIFGTALTGFLLIGISPGIWWRVVTFVAVATWFLLCLPRLIDREDWNDARALWSRLRERSEENAS
jgi:O-antigen/teichoic acid export membrane protein